MTIKRIFATVLVFFATFILCAVLFGSWYTINETERGVLLRNGAFISVENPGLHFKTPFIENVQVISTQSQATVFPGLAAYSRDQQTAVLRVSVSWHIPPTEVATVYSNYKDSESLLERLITRQVPTQVENVFGKYNAVDAVQSRVKLVADITTALRDNIIGPVVIDSVQVENIDFSNAYEAAIEARMSAEVEVKTREQQLQTERVQAAIVVTKAQAQADSAVASAKAEATAIELRGNAEAEAIRAKAAALAQNANLVSLIVAEKWSGVLPTTMVPGSAVPFVQIK